MELFDTIDTIIELNNEHSYLETEVQKTSLDPETYLLNLTNAAIVAFGVAMGTLADDLEESTELGPEFTSLMRSFERLEKCQGGYTIHDENSGNRSNARPQPKRLWQEQKYRALRQIFVAVMSSK
ncbi:hypothetical protein CaCOL14_008216 [Colletotrichum acutatum]